MKYSFTNATSGQPYAELMRGIERLYRTGGDAGGPEAAMLRWAADEISRFDYSKPRTGSGARKPVSRFMSDTLKAAQGGSLDALARAFAAVEPQSDWLQNPNYTAAVMGEEFVANYGYIELVGPKRPFESHTLLVGFLLLGPGTHYPDHRHEAAETYHVVAGAAEWRRGSDAWRVEQPGTAIYHQPNEAHAMRAGDEPLLALYCWSGAIGRAARLSVQGRAARPA